jgi:hypothetical protein
MEENKKVISVIGDIEQNIRVLDNIPEKMIMNLNISSVVRYSWNC